MCKSPKGHRVRGACAPPRVRRQRGAARAGDQARCLLHHRSPRGPGAAGDCGSEFDSHCLAAKTAARRSAFEANLVFIPQK